MAQMEASNSGSERSPALASMGSAADMLANPSHDFGRALAKHFARRKGGLYCVLQCEGQTRHTALVSGSHPAWKQELSFKSVQISSDLQVSMPFDIPSE